MGPDVNHRIEKLPAGLYFVATPIGTARDITLRALDILASADVIAAEDTRTMRRLLDIHGIALGDRPLLAYHDHNGEQARPKLLAFLAQGKAVAYGSEAGTPLIADPGFGLSQAAVQAGALVTTAPGPSAVIAALNVGGSADRPVFLLWVFAKHPVPAQGGSAKISVMCQELLFSTNRPSVSSL